MRRWPSSTNLVGSRMSKGRGRAGREWLRCRSETATYTLQGGEQDCTTCKGEARRQRASCSSSGPCAGRLRPRRLWSTVYELAVAESDAVIMQADTSKQKSEEERLEPFRPRRRSTTRLHPSQGAQFPSVTMSPASSRSAQRPKSRLPPRLPIPIKLSLRRPSQAKKNPRLPPHSRAI